jgi:hypothetical protein
MALLRCKRLYPHVDRSESCKHQTCLAFDDNGLACELTGGAALCDVDKEVGTCAPHLAFLNLKLS